ncbi:MAG: hypothetical protein KZQ76_12410 [Candidatus Thiodiazotropha sp. (ex Epidulcina cf. delphinae)]|nr:hypothetical protein [Candidatus Thiodiazotropha sp. (ex Epidulcina cf. delphinae)]
MILGYLRVGLLPLLLWQTQAHAVNEDQLAVIRELGSLNGIALHCNALAETQRIKRALVLNLPKRRQLGELFDYETDKAFMAFIGENAGCPTPRSLKQRIDAALNRLEAVYKTP